MKKGKENFRTRPGCVEKIVERKFSIAFCDSNRYKMREKRKKERKKEI